VEIIARLYENFLARPGTVYESGDRGVLRSTVELRPSASILGTEGTFHGYDGLLQSAREIIESFQDVRFVPEALLTLGIRSSPPWNSAPRQESDVEVRQTVGHVWAFQADRVVAWHAYMDPVDALEAVRLRQ
jgi:hypothetical protein